MMLGPRLSGSPQRGITAVSQAHVSLEEAPRRMMPVLLVYLENHYAQYVACRRIKCNSVNGLHFEARK